VKYETAVERSEILKENIHQQERELEKTRANLEKAF
jgi:hypothetical protein